MEKVEAIMKTRIKQAQKLIVEIDKERLQLTGTINENMYKQQSILGQLTNLKRQKEEHESCLIYEYKKLDLLEQFLYKRSFSDNYYRKKSIKTCLSVQEMSKSKFHFRMLHGSKSIAKEKQLLKEIRVSQQEEDSFGSFWTELEERLIDSENTWCWDHLKQTWWLHHQLPFPIHNRDSVEDRAGNIMELERRIDRLDIVLQKHGGKAITNDTAKFYFYTVSGKPWTSMGAKKALQEQVEHAVNEIHESRKTKLFIGLGTKIRQAERELVTMEKAGESLKEKLPAINQKRREAQLCLSKLQKQQS